VGRESHSGEAESDPRTPAQRDRDRLLYSSAFRRLAGITQVASPGELYPVHNRLTHSLKVAQVGRSLATHLLAQTHALAIADDLGGLDPDVVEAAALAHDLGHPPFGHVAEQELNGVLVDGGVDRSVPDGYDGNAQSFRIITRLSVRYSRAAGLNLTRATLNATLKYPWFRAQSGKRHTKWGAFESEADDFEWSREFACPGRHERTLEAQLMDWADDITYAVHDVEDFFRAGLIPLDRFVTDSQERDRFLLATFQRIDVEDAMKLRMERAFLNNEVVVLGLPGPFRGSRADRAALRGLTSNLIGKYISRSITLGRDARGRARLEIDPDLDAEVQVLKALTWYYVIESPSLVAQRYGQRALIRSLFRTFCEAALSRNDSTIFPAFFREELERNNAGERGVKRIVADLISGMSESQVVAVHQRLTGESLGSALDMYIQ
jgi:dGTPase